MVSLFGKRIGFFSNGLCCAKPASVVNSLWFQGGPPRYCYSLNLAPESPDDYSNSRPADSAHADDWPVGFCDERIGDAQ